MTSEHWEQVEALFGEALALTPGNRREFVENACPDDQALLDEVLSLLEHHANAGADFLDQPLYPEPDRQPPPDENRLIGSRIGRFRIEGVIATGGMGTVYDATQEQPSRKVALKVMNVEMRDRSAVRRFEFESQILAHLRHAYIAQVFEAGTARPEPSRGCGELPYFAMEFVPDARTITEHADAVGLNARRRLELFGKVCDAVHYGHQHGVIHRDLKPSNILVDDHGEPKVIDFGVARATNSDITLATMHTEVGQLVGTLQYMSPEQCDANVHEIDIRSDVYSLGMVLYELVTGALPYDVSGTAIVQAAQIIKNQQPTRPGTIDRKLRGDIETIVLKALEKEPEKRYGSVADLAQDIRRHLNGRPIEARSPTSWTRAHYWMARHPIMTTTAICVGVVCITLIATSAALWHLRMRPDQMLLRDDKSHARLLSYTGEELQHWSTDGPGRINYAGLLERPPQFGGGLLAVLGCSHALGMPHPGALSAYAAGGNLETAEWVGKIETSSLPPGLRERGIVGGAFGVDFAYAADVFPERVGLEIVAVFTCQFSATAIRVYDMSGALLYQVWHDGVLATCYWMAGHRLLVFNGLNSEASAEERGLPKSHNSHPLVVFALRPKLGFVSSRYVSSTVSVDDDLGVTWYKWLCTGDARDQVHYWSLTPPASGYDPARFFGLDIQVDPSLGAGLHWILDKFGNEVSGTRVVSDNYTRNKNEFPNPDVFKLGPLPPIVSPHNP